MERLFKITIVLLLSIIIYLLIRLESSTPESDFKVIDSGGTINLIDMKSGKIYFKDGGSWYYFSKQTSDSLSAEVTYSGDLVRENNPFQK